MKKKLRPALAAFFLNILVFSSLVACGDSIENVNQTSTEIYSFEKDLPECTNEKEGEKAYIKDDGSTRICANGAWSGNVDEFTCKTEELKDKKGIKIICNGDSIGTVLNGNQGESGVSGKDCIVASQTDSTVTIACGKESTILKLGRFKQDGETEAISIDSLVGYTQKGPFLKGSTVYLYELENGKTLKQTNGNFTSSITSDDGRYKFSARDLISQYAMIIVEGNYRNEVTGKTSDKAIRLKAITDLSKRNSSNVNILSHLEFERVYQLVTKKQMKVYEAKRQAQEEILNLFDIKLQKNTDAEDMNVFGNTDADAALLAISFLLQGNRTEAELMALLAEISDDIAEKGTWDSPQVDSIKAAIADWAFSSEWPTLRKNVEAWNLSGGKAVGNFEKHIEKYITTTYGMETCGDKDDGNERVIKNEWSINDGKVCYCNKGRLIVKRTPSNLNPDIEYGEIIDWRERKPYKTITIAGKTWMAENLDFDYTLNDSSYGTTTYTDEGAIYGRYYSWAAAMDSAALFSDKSKWCGSNSPCAIESEARGICPDGWHIPTETEWDDLYSAIDGSSNANKIAAMQAKGYEKWPNATDAYGFSAIPAGYYNGFDVTNGKVWDAGTNKTLFWSATPISTDAEMSKAWRLDKGNLSNIDKAYGLSVRCVKD